MNPVHNQQYRITEGEDEAAVRSGTTTAHRNSSAMGAPDDQLAGLQHHRGRQR